MVVKYAYIPCGKSGVTQNLPLWSSRVELPVYLKSLTKNPLSKSLNDGLFVVSGSNSYPEVILTILPVPSTFSKPYGP